ncbi:MAG: hypothetical protein ACXW5U_05085 [Thermoanaerobaculia bacterium]
MTLMVGPVVAVPVPKIVLDALVSVRVTSAVHQASGFELTFSMSNRSPLQTLFLLAAGASLPIVRVIIIVTVNGLPHVLMDGVMTNHQISSSGGQTRMTVIGQDLSAVMDLIDFSGVPYPSMPVAARVALVLAKYAMLGVIPLIVPPVIFDVPILTYRIPSQEGKDLAYLQTLAEQSGYVFYVEPGPVPGTSIAYWGPEVKTGIPQRALSLDMDAHSNVKDLSFRYDTDARKIPLVSIQNPETRMEIKFPVPDIGALSPPLALVPPIPTKTETIPATAKLSPAQGAALALAHASRNAEVLTVDGSLDVTRYGGVLAARRLVGVRGAGLAFDGLYFVRSVTHNIERGEYTQNFVLSRNGILPTVPLVVP